MFPWEKLNIFQLNGGPKMKKKEPYFLWQASFIFFSFFFLVQNNNQDQTRRSFFSCLLVFPFFFPTPHGTGAPIGFCQKIYSFFFSVLFRFFLFFQYENNRPTHFLIDSGDGKAGTNARRCVMCLFVFWCCCSCSYRSIASKEEKGNDGRKKLFFPLPSPPFLRWCLVMMMAISCTCHGKERQVGQLFHPLSNKCPPFSWLTSGGG